MSGAEQTARAAAEVTVKALEAACGCPFRHGSWPARACCPDRRDASRGKGAEFAASGLGHRDRDPPAHARMLPPARNEASPSTPRRMNRTSSPSFVAAALRYHGAAPYRRPMQLVLQLTRDCNCACTYCDQADRAGRGMTAAVAERARAMLLDQGYAHVAVTWFGGEPLLERARIEELQPRLQALGAARGALVTAKISTNGALLDESFCRFAKRHALFVSLSTDGCPEAQDQGRPTANGEATSALVERAL